MSQDILTKFNPKSKLLSSEELVFDFFYDWKGNINYLFQWREDNSIKKNSTKIGNQDGYRLPRAFSRDHPELFGASGHVEVLNENTLLVRLNPVKQTKSEKDDVMMSLFLDFLMKTAIEEPESLVAYTNQMSQEANKLLAGVEICED